MKIVLKFLVCSSLLFLAPGSFAQQSKKEIAALMSKQALLLIDNGKPDSAIILLKRAQALDPSNIFFPYEISYVYYTKKDYLSAIPILEKLRTHKNVFSKVYQLLGNCYDNIKERGKAIQIYSTGLNYFPKSPELYLEFGNISLSKKDYYEALRNYENGIAADPEFPSNYYWAAKLYCTSAEKIWGMIYGEIFLVLERDTKRSGEISKLLYYTYKNQVRFYSDSSVSVNFTKTNPLVSDSVAKKIRFDKDVFESTLLKSVGNEKTITLASLSKIRNKFIDTYFTTDLYKQYPNVLFDFQYKTFRAGFSVPYNYWVLSNGNEDEFAKWIKENSVIWERFMDWFSGNTIPFDARYKFLRTQYN